MSTYSGYSSCLLEAGVYYETSSTQICHLNNLLDPWFGTNEASSAYTCDNANNPISRGFLGTHCSTPSVFQYLPITCNSKSFFDTNPYYGFSKYTCDPISATLPVAVTSPQKWYITVDYEGESCQGKILQMTGIAVDKCFIGYDNSSTVIGSIKYSCTGYTVYPTYDCSGQRLSTGLYYQPPTHCYNNPYINPYDAVESTQSLCVSSTISSLQKTYPKRIWQTLYSNDVCYGYATQFISYPIDADITAVGFPGNVTFSCSGFSSQPNVHMYIDFVFSFNGTLLLNTKCSYIAPHYGYSMSVDDSGRQVPIVFSSIMYAGCESEGSNGILQTSSNNINCQQLSDGDTVGLVLAALFAVAALVLVAREMALSEARSQQCNQHVQHIQNDDPSSTSTFAAGNHPAFNQTNASDIISPFHTENDQKHVQNDQKYVQYVPNVQYEIPNESDTELDHSVL